MKRILLFVLTNVAVVAVLGLVSSIFGLNRFIGASGLNLGALLGFALVMGFTGAIFSLLISKPMAKWTMGLTMINDSPDPTHQWIVGAVRKFAEKAKIGMPDVAIYEGDANAFATGAFKNSALVAVSSGLLQSMNREEVEAVIGHEIAHVANGDMVTMALMQGVMNTFVIFLSRVIGYFIDKVVLKNERSGTGIGYMVTVFILDMLLGVVAHIVVSWFSRHREFRADAGSAELMGNGRPMINALSRLGGLTPGELPANMKAMGIGGVMGSLFATHPPMEARIRALQEHAK